jgi:hypothetical protein
MKLAKPTFIIWTTWTLEMVNSQAIDRIITVVNCVSWIYIDETHDYDSANEGTNRFATVLLYLSDVEEVNLT